MTNILHIFTRRLEDSDKILMAAWERKGTNLRFELNPVEADCTAPDYDRLVNLIFETDIAITW